MQLFITHVSQIVRSVLNMVAYIYYSLKLSFFFPNKFVEIRQTSTFSDVLIFDTVIFLIPEKGNAKVNGVSTVCALHVLFDA